MLKPSTFLARISLLALGGSLLLLSGCGNFFNDTTTGTGTTTPTGTVNYVYVGNSGNSTVSGYSISTAGALTALAGSPFTMPSAPTALAVHSSNTVLYVGTTSGVYGYLIGSSGALTGIASGTVLLNSNVTAMDTSSDGKWFVSLDATGLINLCAINNDGSLGQPQATLPAYPNGIHPHDIRFTPNTAFLFAALGTEGEAVYSFNTTTGVLTAAPALPGLTTTNDNGIAFNSTSTLLFIARSGTSQGVAVYTINSDGTLTTVAGTPFAAGTAPNSVVINSTGTYAYVANLVDSTISGFSIGTGGVLTPLASSPYVSGSGVSHLAADSTGKWILDVAPGGTPDLSLYGFDATTLGKLDPVTSITIGKSVASSSIAVTH